MSKIVAIDLDGIIANFTDAFADVARGLGYSLAPDYVPTDWNWAEVLSLQQIDRCWKKIQETDNWWMGVKPYPNVGDSLAILHRDENVDVYFITSRTASAGNSVLDQAICWLTVYGLRGTFGSAIVVKRPSQKLKVLQAIGAHFFIDDKPETVEQVLDEYPACSSFLLTQPWNQSYKTPLPRVSSVRMFVDMVVGPPSIAMAPLYSIT